jgi:hypothetical protein
MLPWQQGEVLGFRKTEIPGKEDTKAIRCRESGSKAYPCQESDRLAQVLPQERALAASPRHSSRSIRYPSTNVAGSGAFMPTLATHSKCSCSTESRWASTVTSRQSKTEWKPGGNLANTPYLHFDPRAEQAIGHDEAHSLLRDRNRLSSRLRHVVPLVARSTPITSSMPLTIERASDITASRG